MRIRHLNQADRSLTVRGKQRPLLLRQKARASAGQGQIAFNNPASRAPPLASCLRFSASCARRYASRSAKVTFQPSAVGAKVVPANASCEASTVSEAHVAAQF